MTMHGTYPDHVTVSAETEVYSSPDFDHVLNSKLEQPTLAAWHVSVISAFSGLHYSSSATDRKLHTEPNTI